MLRAEQTLRWNHRCSCPRPPSWHPQASIRTPGDGSLCSSLCISFVIFLVRLISSWDRPGRRAKGELATCCHYADCGQEIGQNARRHDLDRSNASMNKQKKSARAVRG